MPKGAKTCILKREGLVPVLAEVSLQLPYILSQRECWSEALQDVDRGRAPKP